MPPDPVQILLLPGWQNSGPGHWQSRWEARHGFIRVQQADWGWPRRGDWMMRLEETLLADPRPALLVAHGLGCHLVAAWAAHSQHRAQVRGALLVAPPDLQRAGLPPQVQGWASAQRQARHQPSPQPLPPQPLPFVSTAVLSADDPHGDGASSLALAASWGSEVISLGAAGHLFADSGLGDWPEGLAMLRALRQRAGLPPAAPAG